MSGIKKAAAMGLTLTMVVGMLPAVASAYSSKSGWVKNEDTGKWSYYENGRKIKCAVREDESTGKKYLLDASGNRVTKKGWTTLKYYYSEYGDKIKQSKKYYIQKGGAVFETGFHKVGSKNMYFYEGESVRNSIAFIYTKDGDLKEAYYVGKNGTKITKQGWFHMKGTSYSSYDGDKSKYDYWIYIKKGGKLATGLKKIGKKKYVFTFYGLMVTNGVGSSSSTSNTYYLADKNGVQVTKKGWHKVSTSSTSKGTSGTTTYKSTNWYFVKKDGTLQTGLKKISGKYYYFSPSMTTEYSYTKQGDEYDTVYYFGKDGTCKKTKKIEKTVNI